MGRLSNRSLRRGGSADRRAPGRISRSSWLYIQSGARQGVAVHLGPVESVHCEGNTGHAGGFWFESAGAACTANPLCEAAAALAPTYCDPKEAPC
jgi:hypothetical protein